jgi:hypothetical protein
MTPKEALKAQIISQLAIGHMTRPENNTFSVSTDESRWKLFVQYAAKRADLIMEGAGIEVEIKSIKEEIGKDGRSGSLRNQENPLSP